MGSNKKKKNTEISDLPKELVPSILSLLPTQAAVRLSYVILKGGWKIDMKDLSRLEFIFYDEDAEDAEDRFIRFVNEVLRLRGRCKLESFYLDITPDINGNALTPWIIYSLDNGVQDLNLSIHGIEGAFALTPRVFVQASLVTLTLSTSHGIIDIDEDNVTAVDLPHLKTLCLNDILFGNDAMFVRLISSCPALEKLVMIDMMWQKWEDCFVASSSLKILKIIWSREVDMAEFERCPQSVSFDTPNLSYLEYTDHIARLYPVLNFDSLIEARIRLEKKNKKREEDEEEDEEKDEEEDDEEDEEEDDEEDEEEEGINVVNSAPFFKGINRVQKLHLSANTIQVLEHYCDPIPLFENLTHLTIQSYKTIGWDAIPKLLISCPRLKTFVLEGHFHLATGGCGDVCPCVIMDKDHSSGLVTYPVTHLEIYEVISEGDRGEVVKDESRFVKQVRCFLMRMPHLQQVKIYGLTTNSVAALRAIATELRRLEGKASPNVQIFVLPA